MRIESHRMRSRLNAMPAVLAIALCLSLVPSIQAADVKVFLLGGQSNMDGRAFPANLPTSPVNLQAPQDDVLFYYNSGIGLTTLRTGTNNNGGTFTRFGPEITFGRTMADAVPGETYALIKYALGATNLHTQWNPSGGLQYTTFNSTVTSGIAALEAAGHTPEIVGMLWHQGESDANSANSGNYQANLTNFIADVRSRYGANLPFLIAEIRHFVADSIVVANAQAAVAAADPYSSFIPANDLSYLDVVHLDASGQMDLGVRFADEFLSLLEDDFAAPSPDPMGFKIPPTTISESSITMTASTATDVNGVEYFFENTAGGGNDSGWQDSPTFVDTGLQPNTEYSYRVRARDESPGQNATAFSAPATADTGKLPTIITAIADTNIREQQATSNFGANDRLIANNFFTRITYIRFDVSTFTDITQAKLELETIVDAAGEEYEVFGLLDSDDDWVEGDLTWGNSTHLNGSAIDLTDVYGGAALATFLDQPAGVNTIFDASSGAALDFLNADADGIVTFVIAETGAVDDAGTVWASREHATAQVPTLTLTTTEASDFADWIEAFFPGETAPDVVGSDADPDRDGLSNTEEYAFGLDPDNSGSAAPIATGSLASGMFEFTRRNPALYPTGFTYAYSYSTDLTSWTPFDPASVSGDNGDPVETVTVGFSAPLLDQEDTLFFRVEAIAGD